jgi:hypothetical protein
MERTVAVLSLFFPAYYFVLSFWLDRRSRLSVRGTA